MCEDILVPTDGAPGVEAVTTRALELARAFDATVHAVTVTDTRLEPEGMGEQDRRAWRASMNAQGQAAVAEIRDRVRDAGLDAETAVREGTPYEELLAYADTEGIDLTVVGSYVGESTYPAKLGSTTERVITFGDVPVLTVRPGEGTAPVPLADRYDTVVVGTDGSAFAQRAADAAVSFAATCDASIHAVHVIDEQVYERSDDTNVSEVAAAAGEQAVEDVATRADNAGVSATTSVVRGEPARTIDTVADEHRADLIVLGVRGVRSPTDRLLGSTTSRVIRQSDVPVLVTT